MGWNYNNRWYRSHQNFLHDNLEKFQNRTHKWKKKSIYKSTYTAEFPWHSLINSTKSVCISEHYCTMNSAFTTFLFWQQARLFLTQCLCLSLRGRHWGCQLCYGCKYQKSSSKTASRGTRPFCSPLQHNKCWSSTSKITRRRSPSLKARCPESDGNRCHSVRTYLPQNKQK